ncbi:hypothetical protein Tco_0421490 [Tanacetum coccineum]
MVAWFLGLEDVLSWLLVEGKRDVIAVVRNAIALFKLVIGSSPGRNDGTARPESSWGNLVCGCCDIGDEYKLCVTDGYAGNPNINNGWLAADDYLLGELKAMVNEQMVVLAIEEVAEPVAEAEEEQVFALAIDMEEGQMDAPMMDMEEDLAALFGDDDFKDDASDGFGEEEVWEVNEDWLMAPTTPPLMLVVPPPNVYEVGGPSTAACFGGVFSSLRPHDFLVPPFAVSDVEVAAAVTIGKLGPRVYAVEGQGQQTVAQRDETVAELIQQLQTTVTEMSSRESTLMWCILGLERRIAALERRPPGS